MTRRLSFFLNIPARAARTYLIVHLGLEDIPYLKGRLTRVDVSVDHIFVKARGRRLLVLASSSFSIVTSHAAHASCAQPNFETLL